LKFLFPFFILLLVGCGYKPSDYYQHKIIGKEIKPVVKISAKIPKKTIFLKDALNDAIYTVFNANISNENPNTVIILDIISDNLEALDYDKNGFPILYRSNVSIKATVTDKYGKKHVYKIKSSYDFAVSANTIINDQLKYDAFKQASINALNKLLAKITEDGIKNGND